jgi:hypothetical protein
MQEFATSHRFAVLTRGGNPPLREVVPIATRMGLQSVPRRWTYVSRGSFHRVRGSVSGTHSVLAAYPSRIFRLRYPGATLGMPASRIGRDRSRASVASSLAQGSLSTRR